MLWSPLRTSIPVAGMLAAASLFGVASSGYSQEAKKDAKKVTVKATLDPSPPANTVDFAKAYNLPFESLGAIGARIEAARRHPDPVALAAIANELAVAEAVSQKKADVTAENLAKEAIELAVLRDDSTELKAMALLVKDSEAARKLEAKGTAAAEQKEQELAAVKRGEVGRGILHKLIVPNHSEVTVTVHMNGRPVGWVGPHGVGEFHVHDHSHVTELAAWGPGHHWHGHAVGPYIDYVFELPD